MSQEQIIHQIIGKVPGPHGRPVSSNVHHPTPESAGNRAQPHKSSASQSPVKQEGIINFGVAKVAKGGEQPVGQ